MQENRVALRLKELKENRECALICYVMAGFPKPSSTESIVRDLAAGGADIVEIGIPFSDPIADGPIIQNAAVTALDNGITPMGCLDIVRRVREKNPKLPLMAMTYANVLTRYGTQQYLGKAKVAGIDGFIVPDLPIEEAREYKEVASNLDLGVSFLASPNTTEARLGVIAGSCTAFLYLVSVYGITGARQSFQAYTIDAIRHAKKVLNERVPLSVGFGISSPAHVRMMRKAGADGVIVGSAIIKQVISDMQSKGTGRRLKDFCRSLKQACRD